jgi:hypothetical protein
LADTTTTRRGSNARTENRDSRGRFDSGSSFLEAARSTPAITAVAVTAVAAAGALLWSRRASIVGSKPLMRWGQDSQPVGYDSATAAATFDKQGQSSFDSAYAPPAGGSSLDLSDDSDLRSGASGTGLDQGNATDTKVGSIAYGA